MDQAPSAQTGGLADGKPRAAQRPRLKDARGRSGHRDVLVMRPADCVWPDLESPETAAMRASNPFIGKSETLEVALVAETASFEHCRIIRDTTHAPEIRAMGRESADQEAKHVAEVP